MPHSERPKAPRLPPPHCAREQFQSIKLLKGQQAGRNRGHCFFLSAKFSVNADRSRVERDPRSHTPAGKSIEPDRPACERFFFLPLAGLQLGDTSASFARPVERFAMCRRMEREIRPSNRPAWQWETFSKDRSFEKFACSRTHHAFSGPSDASRANAANFAFARACAFFFRDSQCGMPTGKTRFSPDIARRAVSCLPCSLLLRVGLSHIKRYLFT